MPIPKYDDLFNPLLQAMHSLGGSASISEQEDKVAVILKLTDAEISEIHKGNRTKLSYRLAWARNYLKRYGVIDNSTRGVWALTTDGQKIQKLDKAVVKKAVQALDREITVDIVEDQTTGLISELTDIGCKDKLLDVLKSMAPDAFERLCQRLLRESGFIQVEVTGKTSDGGINGKGVVRIGGLLSFHVIFQCKRYQGSVFSPLVRDFRGAMVGRADKGLLITTGTFTKDARQEAQRDGAPPIDLIDGEALVEKLKELKIGVLVKQKVVEEVIVDESYFGGV
ncbi:restriction endonuclease [Sulfuricella sp. T08]|uniref:restriction endonuclease n=1 Tax=Sulfuricella sp. T08 TaxID=1632857 RepID=UPI0006179C84|nr:restriction endonuclease [Sulfuricella sp. T08]GAO36290.1 restriction endonuclease [Sulfuricella sp. T08]